MKKYLLGITAGVIMAALLVLCGCQSQAAQETEEPETAVETVETEEPAEEPEEEPEEEPVKEEEPEEPAEEEKEPEEEKTVTAPEFVNPLTGEATETDISANRPYVIMLNTIKQAMPQSGNSEADLYYECLEEGGITRIMGVYQDITGIGKIGTIRSTRPYYVRLVCALDGLMVHAGGSKAGLQEIEDLGVSSINALRAASSIFYRDAARKAAGYATEHTMYVNSDDLQEWVANREGMSSVHSDDYYAEHHHEFCEDGTPDGDEATTITVPFSSYKTNIFTYDAENKTYSISMYGSPYIDEQTGEEITVTNVLILKTVTQTLEDKHMQIDLLGTGEGYYLCGGKYIPITWSKDDYSDLFTLTDSTGKEIVFGIGKTYINIIPTDKTVTFE